MNDKSILSKVAASGLTPPIHDTLNAVLEDPTINNTFGGKDGKLSPQQAGLAAAVTVKMQDRLLEQVHRAHERELSLIGGFIRLYRTPVLRRNWNQTEEKTTEPPKASTFAELFSWGNVIGGTAIVLVALSFWYTKTTASFEQSWKRAEQDKTSLQSELEAAEKLNETLADQLARAETRAEETEKVLRTQTASSANQTDELVKAVEALSLLKGQLAAQVSSSKSEQKFQRLYTTSEQQKEELRNENAMLRKQLKEAQDALAKTQ